MRHMCLYPYDAAATGGAAVVRNLKANQACYSCRKQKRKCDKALPSCALCVRMSRHCDYSEVPPNPTVEDVEALRSQLAELEIRLQDAVRQASTSSSISPPAEDRYLKQSPQPYSADGVWEGGLNTFNAVMFLDAKLFRDSGLTVTRPTMNIPQSDGPQRAPESSRELPIRKIAWEKSQVTNILQGVLQCIGDTGQLQRSLSSYFDDIHPWFPVVRKKRINIASTLWDGSPENTLLCLTMMLMAWQPTDGLLVTRNYLYFSAKQFSAQLENAGTASLYYLQALILIALYEYSHGIYPAAWMTVGQCVRYADFIGLPSYKESNSMLGHCATWVEAEERRRAWWAVYVLDKIICVGSDKRPSCGEPSGNEILPVLDEAWDTGDASLAIQHTVTSPRTDFQSAFARLCQAALLISKTLRHCQRAKLLKLQHKPPDHSETAGLIEAAFGLSACLQTEITAQPERYFAAIPALCLTYSAAFKIIATHLEDSPRETTLIPPFEDTAWANRNMTAQMTAFASRKEIMAHMHDIARDISACTSHEEGLAKISPFVLDAVYSTGVTYSWWKEHSGCSAAAPSSEMIKTGLLQISSRWGLAREYVGLLEQHEIAAMSSSGFSMPIAGMPMVPSTMGI
ncbi:fungal-specific transcription factor domain-containing protein [Xylariaceae sp. AK1471]|nr:fungal-specific transcription factor domain-containing protein [Xylariaceae sp. AK1471]